MDNYKYIDGELYCEQVSLAEIAEKVETPCYVYSNRSIADAYEGYANAFSSVDSLICFALKSCANLSVINLLASRGAGADIVSQGEMFRALKAGVPGERIIYSGVGKKA